VSVRLAERSYFVAVSPDANVAFRLVEALRQVWTENPRPSDEIGRLLWKPRSRSYERTGKLTFEIDYTPVHVQRIFRDSERSPLEGQVVNIVAAILTVGREERRLAKERDAARRASEERERRAALGRAAQERDNRAWEMLLRISQNREEATRVRALLAAIERSAPYLGEVVNGRTIAEWIAWAKERTDRLDPTTRGAAGIFEQTGRDTGMTCRCAPLSN